MTKSSTCMVRTEDSYAWAVPLLTHVFSKQVSE